MSKYHIYGIGNALVDIEVEVTTTDLESIGVEKGVMTLVDAERHNELLNALTGTKHNRACGGSAANTVIGAAKLGANCFYSCKIANDETGEFYAKDLQKEGVDSNLSEMNKEEGDTGKCLVMVTPDADRTMNTYLGITGDFSVNQLNEEALKSSDWLYIEGYLVSSDVAKAAAISARELAEKHSVKTALSLSDPNMVKFFGAGLKEMLGEKVNFLFANLEEALMFTEANELEDAVESLKSVADAFAITLGAEGAFVFDGKESFTVDAQPVKAVDTNGAGDLFAGAMLYGISQGYDMKTSARLASFASGTLVTEFGPRLSDEGMNKLIAYKASLIH